MVADAKSRMRSTVDTVLRELGTMRTSVSDAEGLFAGRLAADRADLSAGPRLHRSA